MTKLIYDYHFEHKNNKVQVFYKSQYVAECKSITEAVKVITNN